MNALVYSVGAAILRRLSGFKGYPKAGPGEDTFIQALCGCVVSVAHANGVIDSFTETFPTVRAIRDVALNLRPRFEIQPSEREQWEKKYGKPDPNWSRNLIGGSHESNKLRMLRQAIRDSVYYTEGPGKFRLGQIEDWRERKADIEFWRHQMERMCKKHAPELAAFREELKGSTWEELMKEDWASEAPAVALPPGPEFFKKIEQADIDRAKAARDKAAIAVEDPPDDQDDPDRWE